METRQLAEEFVHPKSEKVIKATRLPPGAVLKQSDVHRGGLLDKDWTRVPPQRVGTRVQGIEAFFRPVPVPEGMLQ